MNNILGSETKLRTAEDFSYMRSEGKKEAGRWVVLVSAGATQSIPRFGIVCGKKYHKHAVKRNRARRLIWESLRHLLPKINLDAKQFVFIPRQSLQKANQGEVEKEIQRLLLRHGHIKNGGISGSPPKESLPSS